MSIDISSLSVAELEKLKGSIDQIIASRRDSELANLCSAIEDMVGESGFSMDEVLQTLQNRPDKKRTIKPKYRNPANPEETWSGRGRKPRWVEEWMSSGRELDECLIAE